MEHGWLEVEGKLVDPTPVYHSAKREKKRYFPVRRYTLTELRKKVLKRGKTSLPLSGHVWLREPDFKAAYHEAERHAYGEETFEKLQKMRASLNT
jgi:hypothetical protein